MGEMLGMGIAIQLRNMFSAPAAAVVASSKTLTQAITRDQETALNGWKLMGAGASMAFIGTGLLAFVGKIGEMSVKSSSDLEVFRMQIRLLSHDTAIGDNLFAQLKTFGATTPFTIPQVMAGAKNLLAFGVSSQKVMDQLRIAGDWASMMNMPIDEASMIIGKVNSGAISYALRSLHRAGISSAAIRAEGGPIDAKGRTAAGADPQKFLDAVNKVIEKQFGGSMTAIMGTIPGMVSNMKDQFILMGSAIGDVAKPIVKDVMHSFLSIFDPKLVLPFAQAVGEGLAFVLKYTVMLLAPIGHAVIWFMKFAGTHPAIMKIGIAVIAVTGAVLNLAGASLILLGIWTIIQSLLASAEAVAFFAGFAEIIPIILGVAAAATVLYTAFSQNFMGMASRVMWFYERIRVVGQGLVDLFSTIHNGVGYMTLDTANALNKYGLLGVAVQLFMMGYRVYQFFLGVADAMQGFVTVLGYAASVVSLLLIPVEILAAFGLRVAQAFGYLNVVGWTSSSMFQNMGRVVGTLLAAFITYKTVVAVTATLQALWTGVVAVWNIVTNASTLIMYAWTGIIRVVTAAQWLWNAAMMANPIGLIIAGVVVLGIGIYLLISHFKQLTSWFSGLPTWGKVLLMAFAPWLAIPLWIGANWEKVKAVFTSVGHVIKDTMGAAITWLIEKVEHLWVLMSHLPFIKGMDFPISAQPMPAGYTTMDKLPVGLPPRQSELLTNTGRQAQDSRTLENIHGELQNLNRMMATPPATPPLAIHLDGRVLARTVNKHNAAERSAGR